MLTEQRWGDEPVNMEMTSHREFLNVCLGCAATSATPSSQTRSTIPT